MKTTILACGQIRRPRLFRAQMQGYLELRDAGIVADIVVSTWETEIEDQRTLIDDLARRGVRIVANPPLRKTDGSVSFFAQMKQLHAGLRHVEDEHCVFKIRPDVCLEIHKLPAFFQRMSHAPVPSGPFALFRRPMWVPFFEATVPFFLSDFIYYAHKHDLSRLCNFDMGYEFNDFYLETSDPGRILGDDPLFPEARFYASPFLSLAPVFKEMGEIWFLLLNRKMGLPERISILSHVVRIKNYWEYLAAYYMMLRDNYKIGKSSYDGNIFLSRQDISDEEPGKFYGFSIPYSQTVNPSEFLRNFTNGLDMHGYLYCNDGRWLENIFSATIDDPFFRNVFQERLNELEASPMRPTKRHTLQVFKKELTGILAQGDAAAS